VGAFQSGPAVDEALAEERFSERERAGRRDDRLVGVEERRRGGGSWGRCGGGVGGCGHDNTIWAPAGAVGRGDPLTRWLCAAVRTPTGHGPIVEVRSAFGWTARAVQGVTV